MGERGALPRRSAKEWGVRLTLALLVALLGIVATRYALAAAIAGKDPVRAHQMAPGDGLIAATLAGKQFVEQPESDANSPTARLARQALRQEPTAVEAVATLGLQAQVRGDTARARLLFAYAQTLSRRHLETQLWAIEDAVGRNNIPEALRHYDIALRTSGTARELLFPVLAAAIAEPAVRSSLVKTLQDRPVWGPDLISYVAAGQASDPYQVAVLFGGLQRASVPIPPQATSALINRLIAADAVDQAWSFYRSVRSRADRTMSRDPRFTTDLTHASVFDWVPVNDANVSTSIQPRAQGGLFSFSAPATAGGVLLRQVQVLPSGDYRLEGHSRDIEQPEQSLPYWVLSCRSGRELGRVVVPNSSKANGAFTGTFTVPADCPMQTLALVARPSDEIAGMAGQIDRVRLAPAR